MKKIAAFVLLALVVSVAPALAGTRNIAFFNDSLEKVSVAMLQDRVVVKYGEVAKDRQLVFDVPDVLTEVHVNAPTCGQLLHAYVPLRMARVTLIQKTRGIDSCRLSVQQ
jgi:hypothetical protein